MRPSAVAEIEFYGADEETRIWTAVEAALGETRLPPPFWAFAWPGGRLLARWLLDHPAEFRGARIVALAAGAGLEALAAARIGARRVTWNDMDPIAEIAFAMNADRAGVAVEHALGDAVALADATAPGRDADVLLLGDAFYERAAASALFDALQRFVARGGRALVAEPDRGRRPAAGLRRLARRSIPTDAALESTKERITELFEVCG